MITKTSLQHPALLLKIARAMREAMTTASEKNRVSALTAVKNRRGDLFLYVIYSRTFNRFTFTDCKSGKLARSPRVTETVNRVFAESKSAGLQALASRIPA